MAKFDLENESKKVSLKDAERVLANVQAIQSKAASGPLAAFWDTIGTLISLVQDYTTGRYREVPWRTIAAIVAALAYVLCPIDMIPDFIPFAGLVDDAAVLTLLVSAIHFDLETYRQWKEVHQPLMENNAVNN